jgi:DNA-binding CsgD family transcriptional regulator
LTKNPPDVESLSQRQKEILRLIAHGHQTKEIARALDIRETTIKTHTETARQRLGVATSREAARLLQAYESGAPLLPGGGGPAWPIAEVMTSVSPLSSPPVDESFVTMTPLEQKLAGISNLQWLGLQVVIAAVAVMVVGGLLTGTLGTLEAIQLINRHGH